MQPLQKKSIAIGLLADIGGTFVLMFILGFIAGVLAASRGVDVMTLTESTPFTVLSVIVGFSFTILGGFIASTRAKYRHVAHGGWVAGTGIIIAIPFIALSLVAQISGQQPLDTGMLAQLAAYLILAIPAGMLGGYLGEKFDRRREAANTPVMTV